MAGFVCWEPEIRAGLLVCRRPILIVLVMLLVATATWRMIVATICGTAKAHRDKKLPMYTCHMSRACECRASRFTSVRSKDQLFHHIKHYLDNFHQVVPGHLF